MNHGNNLVHAQAVLAHVPACMCNFYDCLDCIESNAACCPFTAAILLSGLSLSSPQLLKLESFLHVKTVIRLFSVSAFSKQEEGELGITGDKKGFDGICTCV